MTPRFQRILVAVDGSELSIRALATARDLAEATAAHIGLVHVVAPDPADTAGEAGSRPWTPRRQEGQRLLDRLAASLPSAPWTLVREGHPATEIAAAALEWSADLIVLGTHGRSGLARLWLGSTAEGVARHGPCPVVIVPPAPVTDPG